MHNENNLCDSKNSIIFTCPGHNIVYKNFRYSCTKYLVICWLMNGKISRRVGMNWNFKGRRKRGGDDVDINARSSNPAPCYYQHQLLLLARINKSAKQSSTRVNNCVLYLTLLQSDTNPCLDCITLFAKYWNTPRCPAKQTTLGRGRRGRSLREDVVDNGGDQPILQDETGQNQWNQWGEE